jgi:hypothetical protein
MFSAVGSGKQPLWSEVMGHVGGGIKLTVV